MIEFPFERFNLRRNPFGELTRAERAAQVVFDAAPLIAHLSRPGRAIQFVGQCGRGKSSHLLGLSAKIDGGAYVRMRLHRENPEPRACQVLLMDEVDHVSRRVRKRWALKAGSVAWAVHEDRGRELRRLGFDLLTVAVDGNTDADRLFEVFARRIEYVRRSGGAVPSVDLPRVQQLIQEYGTDIRAMERELYEEFQALVKK